MKEQISLLGNVVIVGLSRPISQRRKTQKATLALHFCLQGDQPASFVKRYVGSPLLAFWWTLPCPLTNFDRFSIGSCWRESILKRGGRTLTSSPTSTTQAQMPSPTSTYQAAGANQSSKGEGRTLTSTRALT